MSSIFQGLVTPDKGLVKFDIGTSDVTVSAADLPGSSGDYFSTPDSADNSIRQSIIFEADIAPDDWTPAASNAIIGKRTTGQEAFQFLLAATTGYLEIAFYTGGVYGGGIASTVATGFTDGTRHKVRASFDTITTTAIFETSSDGGLTWTQLGDAVVNTNSTYIDDTTAGIEIGSILAGTTYPFTGTIYSATVTKGPTPYPYVLLDGASGTYVSTPDTPENSVTGSITVEVDCAADDWTPDSVEVVLSKWASAGDERCYEIYLRTNGTIGFGTSSDGTSSSKVFSVSTAATGFADGSRAQIRGDFDPTAQTVTFYTATDGVTWVQLGDVVAHAATSIYDGTTDVVVGAVNGGTTNNFNGKIYSAKVYDGIGNDAVLVADFDPQPYLQGDSTFVAPETGETWTLQGNAIATSPIDDGVKVDFNPAQYQGGVEWFVGQLGPNLLTNAHFAMGLTDWVTTTGVVSGGKLIVSGNGAAAEQQNITTEIKTYLAMAEVDAIDPATNGAIYINDTTGIGTPIAAKALPVGVSGRLYLQYDSTITDTFFILRQNTGAAVTCGFYNAALREVVEGYLWTINGNASVVASTRMRSLYIDPQAYPAFPIYASTGQALASKGAGGMTFDANGRIRVTQTLPSALTRVNELAVVDITDVSNWVVDSAVSLDYDEDTGWFTVKNASGTGSAFSLYVTPNDGGVNGVVMQSAAQFEGPKGTNINLVVNRVSGGSSVLQAVQVDFDGDNPVFASVETTGVTSNNNGAWAIYPDSDGPYPDSFRFRFPTLEYTTSYPAGVPPIVIPVDTVIGFERIPNGNFDSADYWDFGAGWSITGNVAVADDAKDTTISSQERITLAAGDRVHVTANGTRSAGQFTLQLFLVGTGVVASGTETASAVWSNDFYFTVVSSGVYFARVRGRFGSGGSNGTVKNVSLKEVTNGIIEVPAQYQLPGGMRSSGPTQELIVYGEQQVWHQGVGLTNQGYVADYLTNTLLAEALVWLDESTITGDGQVSAWTNQGIGGSAYDLDTVVGTAANLTVLPNDAARGTGVSGDFYSTVALSSVGTVLDVQYLGKVDVNAAVNKALVAQWEQTGNLRAFRLVLMTTGTMRLSLSTTGTDFFEVVSTENYPSDANGFRSVWNQATDETIYYTTTDSGVTWDQLGDPVPMGTGHAAMYASSALVTVCADKNGGTEYPVAGYCTSAKVYNGANTPATSYVTLDGTGDYISTPHSTANTVTGDIDLRARISIDDATPTANEEIAAKGEASGDYAWIWRRNITTGQMSLLISDDGTTIVTAQSGVAFPIGVGLVVDLRVTWSDADDEAVFYWKYTNETEYTVLATVALVSSGIFASDADVYVGAFGDGTNEMFGKVYSFEMRDGIDGDVVAKCDPLDYLSGTAWKTPVTSLGPELIDNSDLSAWSGDTPFDYDLGTPDAENYIERVGSTNAARLVSDGTSFITLQQTITTAGSIYQYEVIVDEVALNNGQIADQATLLATIDEARPYTRTFLAAGNGDFDVKRQNTVATDFTVSNISVRQALQGGEVWTLNGTAAVSQFEATGSTLVVDFDPSDYVSGSTFTGPLGETWTLNGDVFINKTGQSVVNSAGSVGIEPAAGVTIANSFTVFMAAKFTEDTLAADQFLFDRYTSPGDRCAIFVDISSGDQFRIFQDGAGGAAISGYDTDVHIFTGEFNGDATTKLTVSDVGNITADAGADDWVYGAFFINTGEALSLVGWIGEVIVFPRALTATEITDMQNYLQDKWL